MSIPNPSNTLEEFEIELAIYKPCYTCGDYSTPDKDGNCDGCGEPLAEVSEDE